MFNILMIEFDHEAIAGVAWFKFLRPCLLRLQARSRWDLTKAG
jgi:hypothetical protein